jgi:hypothetical protein
VAGGSSRGGALARVVRRRGVDRPWGVLGVPSSVAVHWPEIEQAPAAMRAAGLIERLLRRIRTSSTTVTGLLRAGWPTGATIAECLATLGAPPALSIPNGQ